MTTIKPTAITISSLKYVKPVDLANSLRQEQTRSKVAVIDVRDNDHVGGHIRGSRWVPVNQLDARMAELLRVNAEKDRVIFHCMLSQQRGPKAALAYARARAYQEEKNAKEIEGSNVVGTEEEMTAEGSGKVYGQEICVLEGGFGAWQAYYGRDKDLTEGYVSDIWED